MHLLRALQPSSILDVGVGMGALGMLARQTLDIANGNLPRDSWKVRIDGIEVFEPYRNPLWEYYYDAVALGEAREEVRKLERTYDMALCCDVLEHFDLDDAVQFAHEILNRARCLLITTPNEPYRQAPTLGNNAERHRSYISPDAMPHVVLSGDTGTTWWIACSSDPETASLIRQGGKDLPRVTVQQSVGTYIKRILRRRFRRKGIF